MFTHYLFQRRLLPGPGGRGARGVGRLDRRQTSYYKQYYYNILF